jgi:predicted permease
MIPGLRRFFRLPLSRTTLVRDVDEEIAFHLESRTADLVSSGMTPHEARLCAEREFGDVARARSELAAIDDVRLRAERRSDVWDATLHEVRQAARGLRRTPGFTLAVVVMLALGIGVNAAMFGITDRLLLSPPAHVQGADALVRVMYEYTPRWDPVLRAARDVSYADYVSLREGVGAFEQVAAYGSPSTSSLGRGADGQEVKLVSVTEDYFVTLGVSPLRGRFFSADEHGDGDVSHVVVLSHGLWQRRFGGDDAVIGSVVDIDNRPFTIVGVAPRGFNGIDLTPVHGWVPVAATAPSLAPNWRTARDVMTWLLPIARLAPGVTRDAAATEAHTVYFAAEEIRQRHEGDATARVVLGELNAARVQGGGPGALAAQRSGRIALWLLGVSTLVLIIASANVANLLVARSLRRRREIGVRMALGVSRLRLAGEVLAETLLIAVAATSLGLLLAHWSGQLGRALLLPDFEWTGSPVDGRMLVFAICVAVASALLAGLLPALLAARADVVRLLALGGRSGTYSRSPLRAGLVMLQATLSLVLLVGAGLFVRSLENARTLHLGYEPDRVALLSWHRTGLGWSRERTLDLYDRSLERAQALPAVESAALSMFSPLWGAAGAQIRVPGRDSIPLPPGMFGFMYDAVTPDWFRTMGTRLQHGRVFTAADADGAAPVVIVTASLAELLWPGENALGRCFVVRFPEYDRSCREVVGIVEDMHYRSLEARDMLFFVPLAQVPPFGARVLSVRTHGRPAGELPAVSAALHGLEPGLPFLQTTLLADRLAPQLQPWRLGAAAFSAFSVLALLLAALGLYGVVAYDVAQRTREMGVRIALGARALNVARLVLTDALRVVVPGLLMGLALAFWLAPRLEGLLFDVGPHDARVLMSAALLLLGAALAAALLPGRRAARVQPVEALRVD